MGALSGGALDALVAPPAAWSPGFCTRRATRSRSPDAGALMTGVMNNQKLGGPGLITDWVTMKFSSNGMYGPLVIRAMALFVTVGWSGVTT